MPSDNAERKTPLFEEQVSVGTALAINNCPRATTIVDERSVLVEDAEHRKGSPYLDPLLFTEDHHLADDECAFGAADRLLASITATFPDLSLKNCRIDSTGGDHVLLFTESGYAFRFPRAGVHDLKLEIAILKAVQRRSIVPTPRYGYVDPSGRFAGYRFIAGEPLTRERFTALPMAAQHQLLAEAARFLSELHWLPVDAMGWSGRWPKTWTAAEFADRGLTECLPLIARRAAHLARPIEAFYNRYRRDRANELAIVHGDLVPDHMLLDQHTGRLAGIIDFGDVALGDPAQDFLGFWSYGGVAAARAIELYDPSNTDPGLLARSRNHFIRYRIDRLFETLSEAGGIDARREIAEVDALLTNLPVANETIARRE